jgi:hypothetical protein
MGRSSSPLNHAVRDYANLNVVNCRYTDRADILKALLPPHAQSVAARDGDERREQTTSISYILLLIAEFHLFYLAEEGELRHE